MTGRLASMSRVKQKPPPRRRGEGRQAWDSLPVQAIIRNPKVIAIETNSTLSNALSICWRVTRPRGLGRAKAVGVKALAWVNKRSACVTLSLGRLLLLGAKLEAS